MANSGRKRDSIWEHFIELPKVIGKTGIRAKCRYCDKELQGLVARLKLHHNNKCESSSSTNEMDETVCDSPFTINKKGKFKWKLYISEIKIFDAI